MTDTRRPDLRVSQLAPDVAAGLLNGALEVVVATSFAALIFSGALSTHLADGIGITLFAATVTMAVVALRATLPATTASVQDSSAAILAIIAASVASQVAAAGGDPFLTAVLAIALTSILTGLAFSLLGVLRLGDLVRFVPYPVVGGFLAGTGWVLATGAVEVLGGVTPTPGNLANLFEPAVASNWGAGAAVAVILLLITRRFSHVLALPLTLLTAVVVFYGVVFVSGGGLAAAERGGWLLGPLPQGGLWEPWVVEAVTRADWGVVGGQAGTMATAVLVGLLGFLLNASAIEVAVEQEVDLNRDLRATGLANLAGGAGGGIPGFHALALTVIAHRTGARSRLAGLVAAAVCGITLVIGGQVVALFPRTILGGMLLFVGLSFLVDWVYDARRRLHVTEHLLVLLILAVIAIVGYLPGVAVGLIAAVIMFAVAYARLDFIRHRLSGATYQSRVERTSLQREVLDSAGDRITIMELHGFLFFGTANRLLDCVTRRIADPDQPPLEFLVLDFRLVTGHDSSAVMSFVGIKRLAQRHGFALVLTGLHGDLEERFAQGGLDATTPRLIFEGELDRGVQWCEDRILADHGVEGEREHQSLERELHAQLGTDVGLSRLVQHLTRVDVSAGHEVIRQGDAADDVYFVESGTVTVELTAQDGSKHRLRTMSTGSVLGELPLYLGGSRTASVLADEDCVLYRLPIRAVADIEREAPEVAAALHRFFAQLMARRLAASLQSIQALLE